MCKKKVLLFIIALIVFITVPAHADMLKVGSTGVCVKELQKKLIIEGYLDCEATGYYGNLTKDAVKSFQRNCGLSVDGIVGNDTQNALKKIGTSYDYKDNTERLKQIQTILKDLDFYKGKVDGIPGPLTNTAIESFQRNKGLTVDGIVGDETMYLLIITEKGFNTGASKETPSRGNAERKSDGDNTYGEMLDWWTEVINIFPRGAKAQVIDFKTGKSFNIQRSYGGNHADCETLTKEDTKKMKEIWGGKWSWDRRPVLIVVGERKIAASMIGMPHAGLDSKPAEAYVKGRSGGFGSGTNLDAVKGNGMDGHFCIHFLNSRTHGTNKVDAKHQANIKIAAGK